MSVKIRAASSQLALWALCVGLLLRAATPVGYMPTALSSGLLFELCPGQLPAGFVLPGTQQGHEHHHHSGHAGDDDRQAEPDTCQVGHLLLSATAVGEFDIGEAIAFEPAVATTRNVIRARSAQRSVHRSRGPPA